MKCTHFYYTYFRNKGCEETKKTHEEGSSYIFDSL